MTDSSGRDCRVLHQHHRSAVKPARPASYQRPHAEWKARRTAGKVHNRGEARVRMARSGYRVCGPGCLYGMMMRGTGEWRARPTATEPTTRWVAWDELPTMIATLSPGWASPMAVAAAIS